MLGASAAALRRGHRQRVELAVLHLRQRRIEIVGQDLDVAAEGRLQRRTGAAERHMHHLQSRELQQPGHREVRALPDAGRAIGQLVRIGLDVGDHLGDRLDRHRRMRRDDIRNPDQVADRLQLIGLVLHVAEDAVGDRVGAGIADQDGVPVALLAHHLGGADGAAAAGAVFHHRGLAPAVCRCAASNRPITSVVPPGAAGTIRRTVSVGRQSAPRLARGRIAAAETAAAPVSTRRREISLVTFHSLLGFLFAGSVGKARPVGKRRLGAGRALQTSDSVFTLATADPAPECRCS